MKQLVLVSFSNDIPLLNAIHQSIPSSIDLWTLPFNRRSEAINSKNQSIIVITTFRSQSPEGLNQLSVLKTEYPWLPIILVAHSPERDEIITAFKLGADDLLLFPVSAMKMMESIRQVQNRKPGVIKNFRLSWRNFFLPFWNFLTYSPYTSQEKVAEHKLKVAAPPLAAANILPAPDLSSFIQQQAGSQKLSVNLLGKFEIAFRGHTLKRIPAKKERSLLAYLLFKHHKDLNKEILMEKFWPDSSPSSARNCLNVTIHKVRKCLQKFCGEEEIIIYKDECYSINSEIELELDVSRFMQLWKKGSSLPPSQATEILDYYQQAADLYRGDFMEQMLYEKWTESEREKIKEAYLHMLNALSLNHFKQGRLGKAVELANRMLEKDNCLEEVHRLLINCYYLQSQNDKAIRQYFKCKDILHKELNVNPSEATRDLFEKIKG